MKNSETLVLTARLVFRTTAAKFPWKGCPLSCEGISKKTLEKGVFLLEYIILRSCPFNQTTKLPPCPN